MPDPDLHEFLIQHLEASAKAYDKRPRYSAIFALDAVIKHLQIDLQLPAHLYAPLVQLSGALCDAAQGIHNPLIEPAKYEGGPRSPIQDALAWAQAAVAVTLQRDAGDTLKQALRRAASAGSLDAGEDDKKLKEFRKRITRGDPTVRQEALEHYTLTIQSAHALLAKTKLTRRHLAEAALMDLKNMRAAKV